MGAPKKNQLHIRLISRGYLLGFIGYGDWIIPIYKPESSAMNGRGPTTLSLGDLPTMEINHLLNGMILQVELHGMEVHFISQVLKR